MSEAPFGASYFRLYGRDYGTPFDRYVKARSMAPVYRFLHAAPGDGPILDLGSGMGLHAEILAERGRTLAVEYSPYAARLCRARGLDVANASATGIPLRDGSVRAALFYDVLCTLAPDQAQRALAEIRRVLAPGGRLALLTPNWDGRSVRDGYYDPYHQHAYSRAEVEALLDGFTRDVRAMSPPAAAPGAGKLGAFAPLRPLAYGMMRASGRLRRGKPLLVALATRKG